VAEALHHLTRSARRIWSAQPASSAALAAARDGACGAIFGERLQHEGALVHARVRHACRRGTRDAARRKQQVEVERARRVANGRSPAVLLLDAWRSSAAHGRSRGVEPSTT
jgi:hypothetical protein